MHFTHHVLPRDCKFSEIPRKCARGRYFNTDFCTAYRFLALLIIMYYVCYTSSLFFHSTSSFFTPRYICVIFIGWQGMHWLF